MTLGIERFAFIKARIPDAPEVVNLVLASHRAAAISIRAVGCEKVIGQKFKLYFPTISYSKSAETGENLRDGFGGKLATAARKIAAAGAFRRVCEYGPGGFVIRRSSVQSRPLAPFLCCLGSRNFRRCGEPTDTRTDTGFTAPAQHPADTGPRPSQRPNASRGVANFFAVAKTAEVASHGFRDFARAPIVFGGRITTL